MVCEPNQDRDLLVKFNGLGMFILGQIRIRALL